MGNVKMRSVLISDFNLDVFSGYLNNDEDLPEVDAVVAPFGQVPQLLIQEDSEYWKDNPDFAVIWTRPEGVITSFNEILSYNPRPTAAILKEVDQFASLILNASSRAKSIFVPAWTCPPSYRGLGMLDMKKDIGTANILMQMNLRLSENVESKTNIYILNAQHWVDMAGKHAHNPKLWYRGKIAFGNNVYKQAVKDLKAALTGISGKSRKIIILDLDDTLWGGIVGDEGWENLVLGGHDPAGEAFRDFQFALKAMTNRGILLGIVSKNDESTALEAIKNHPEMVLKLKDFAGWRINWQDKATNIIDLVSDLNLGIQSAVFIDDNPRERARIRDAFPEILVPEWPEDPMLYKSTLLGLRCFDVPSISKEDMERANMYVSEKKRKELKQSMSSIDDWLENLQTRVKIEELNNANLQRTAQLFNKTNQMNLATRRMTEGELMDWTRRENHKLWTFRVTDKLGDSGLTGIISLETNGKTGKIADFILSCRVMGRKVEESMLYNVIKYARESGLDKVVAEYIPTPKNGPCLEFWKRSGFDYDENSGSFSWDLNKEYRLPRYIELVLPENVSST